MRKTVNRAIAIVLTICSVLSQSAFASAAFTAKDSKLDIKITGVTQAQAERLQTVFENAALATATAFSANMQAATVKPLLDFDLN
jgi:low affinity Fe/Cu permease